MTTTPVSQVYFLSLMRPPRHSYEYDAHNITTTNNLTIRNRKTLTFLSISFLFPYKHKAQLLPTLCLTSTPAYLVGLTEEGVTGTALVDDVPDQVLLPVVGGEHADAVGGVAQQAHVHEEGHRVLCLCQVL